LELNEELKRRGHQIKSSSDAETIIHAYEEWGPECLNKFNGMWAFVIWDQKKQEFFCARDRFGIKPFYYYFDGKNFVFASEIKALLAYPGVPREPNVKIINWYLNYGTGIYSADTFFKGIKKLLPAEKLTVKIWPDKLAKDGPRKFWDLDINRGEEKIGLPQAAEKFRELFYDAVRLRLRSDVPGGVFLSGGLDSSAVAVTMSDILKKQDGKNLAEYQESFTAGFADKEYDETAYAEEVIKSTGFKKNILRSGHESFFSILPQIIWHQDEPVARYTVYSHWQLARRVADKGLKMVLVGLGGDEIMAGYGKDYGKLLADLFWRGRWCLAWRESRDLAERYRRSSDYFRKMAWQALWSGGRKKPEERYAPLLMKSDLAEMPVPEPAKSGQPGRYLKATMREMTMRGRLPFSLQYDDRNFMAFGLEGRVPFMDYRLVEFIFRLPVQYLVHEGKSKYVMRRAYRGIMPERIRTRRVKFGFSPPFTKWLRNELQEETAQVINSASFRGRAYFNHAAVRKAFREYTTRKDKWYWGETFWRLLFLELWFRVFFDQKEPAKPPAGE
jgi:asparagine synthase (glutamine-hydrolysing)